MISSLRKPIETVKSDQVTFKLKERSKYCVFIGNGEIDLVNQLLELGTMRAKLKMYLSEALIMETDMTDKGMVLFYKICST